MKTKKMSKKLYLKKQTVYNLNNRELSGLKGRGATATVDTCTKCRDWCITETCDTCINPTASCNGTCDGSTCDTCYTCEYTCRFTCLKPCIV